MGIACSAFASAQDRRESPERIQKLIEVSIEGSQVVRPQAAERLLKMGDKARPLVLAHLAQALSNDDEAVPFEGWFDLGADFLLMAARMTHDPAQGEGDPSVENLRARLWAAVEQPYFPWRPQILEGLGTPPRAGEVERFGTYLDAPLASVRIASLAGLRQGDPALWLPKVRARMLRETDDRVLRALADTAIELGDPSAAWVLIDQLAADESFFDQPMGHVARLDATRLLRLRFPTAPIFNPNLDPNSAEARAAREEQVQFYQEHLGERPQATPARQSSLARQGQVLFGVELRSCRAGEHFLRWTDRDQLWIGRLDPAVVRLPEGTVARLLAAASTAGEAMGKQYLTGQVGCDLETYYLPVEGKDKPQRFLVTKGPKPVEGLRPAALNRWIEAWLPSLPAPIGEASSEASDERLVAPLQDAGRALFHIGGAYEGSEAYR